MATQAELEAQLEALKKARANGAQTIRYTTNGNERAITYRIVDDINKAIAAVESDLANASGTNIVRAFRFVPDKDL